MSVPRPRRNENKLQALKDAEEAISYIVLMCNNENCIPKKFRWSLANRIIDEGINLILNISEANKIRAKTVKEYEERINKQTLAIESMNRIWVILTLIEKTIPMEVRKLDKCCELLYKSEVTLVGWKQSDVTKYKKLLAENAKSIK